MDKSPAKPEAAQLSRRRVFAGAGAAGALAAAAVVVPAVRQPDIVAASTPAPPADDTHGRYRLSEHVQRYYQTAKV